MSSDSQILFPGASGRGVKIAVIDSGVNAAHPHICAPVTTALMGADTSRSGDDTFGHGTAVTAAIQEKAPAAEYFAVKLFGSSLRTTTSRLLEAIEWAITNRMDIINLSLGTTNIQARAEFQALVEQASSVGCVLVSACDGSRRPLLPGALPGAIGVDVDWDLPRHHYRIADSDGGRDYFASGYPRPLPGVPPARNLNGISFAVANMTGFVARAYEGLRDRSLESVRHTLESELRAYSPETATARPALSADTA